MSNTELHSKVQELRELRRMASELEREIESIQNELKAHMDRMGVDRLEGTDFTITWKEVQTSRFDKAAFVNTFGTDYYVSFCKTTTTRRFCVA